MYRDGIPENSRLWRCQISVVEARNKSQTIQVCLFIFFLLSSVFHDFPL
nr:MAG TPA: hypothetical protein [Caudoviricetes sp.]